jgi:hypothetical protein
MIALAYYSFNSLLTGSDWTPESLAVLPFLLTSPFLRYTVGHFAQHDDTIGLMGRHGRLLDFHGGNAFGCCYRCIETRRRVNAFGMMKKLTIGEDEES